MIIFFKLHIHTITTSINNKKTPNSNHQSNLPINKTHNSNRRNESKPPPNESYPHSRNICIQNDNTCKKNTHTRKKLNWKSKIRGPRNLLSLWVKSRWVAYYSRPFWIIRKKNGSELQTKKRAIKLRLRGSH